MQGFGYADGYYDDGEWILWEDIEDEEEIHETELQRLERIAALKFRYPHADPALIPYFRDMLFLAEDFHRTTGRHLQVYGDIGELFGAIEFGIKLHKNYAQGSDGRLGDDYVEIKTITPFKSHDRVQVKLHDRNFSKLLVVRIDADFRVRGRMIDREQLRPVKKLTLAWDDMPPLKPRVAKSDPF